MTIQQIYDHYDIMPSLQLHMLRVTAVAAMIVESFNQPLDKNNIIKACLLHDMGNIVKFDFNYMKESMPQFLEPLGLKYWQKVKDQFVAQFGSDEYEVTNQILNDLDVNSRIKELINCNGFVNLPERKGDTEFGKKISVYSDCRVGPYGVLPLIDRLNEGRERFRANKKHHDDQVFEEGVVFLQEIELQIFAHTSIKPVDIVDVSIEKSVLNLRNYVV